jgi:hypothetical protein
LITFAIQKIKMPEDIQQIEKLNAVVHSIIETIKVNGGSLKNITSYTKENFIKTLVVHLLTIYAYQKHRSEFNDYTELDEAISFCESNKSVAYFVGMNFFKLTQEECNIFEVSKPLVSNFQVCSMIPELETYDKYAFQ